MTTQTEDGVIINLERKINESYDIIIGSELFPGIAQDLVLLKDESKISKFAIITDSKVGPLHAVRLESCLIEQGLDCRTFSFKAGEKNKNMDTVTRLLNQLGEAKYNRDTLILALGGGVVGDTAGLVAALINRGVPYVQIPTTTLSQADSAVGGKTGVDLPAGKNLVGAFKQPLRVYMDVATLDTLDDRNYRAGLVEVIKHGIIQDTNFFDYLEQNMDRILAKDKEVLIYLAKQNSRIKGTVVEKDPNEKGLRRILNYGHTAGHAIETLSDYELLHGEAIAMGINVAGTIAYLSETGFGPEDLGRQNRLLERLGLQIRIPQHITNKQIIEKTASDKKAASGKVRYCLPSGIGDMMEFDGVYSMPIEANLVVKAIDMCR
jgi:3-dehydroquinate synthase